MSYHNRGLSSSCCVYPCMYIGLAYMVFYIYRTFGGPFNGEMGLTWVYFCCAEITVKLWAGLSVKVMWKWMFSHVIQETYSRAGCSVGQEIQTLTGFWAARNRAWSQTLTDRHLLFDCRCSRLHVPRGDSVSSSFNIHCSHASQRKDVQSTWEGKLWLRKSGKEKECCGCKPLNPTLTPNGVTAGLKD